jgi:aromatic ring hydroxylase
MLDRNQETRIKIKDVLKHPWFKFEEHDRVNQEIQQQQTDKELIKKQDLHEEVSKNLNESFRRSSRDPAVNLVMITSLDKSEIKAPKTPALDKVDENNEDI